jgi:hypothetical protein
LICSGHCIYVDVKWALLGQHVSRVTASASRQGQACPGRDAGCRTLMDKLTSTGYDNGECVLVQITVVEGTSM